MNQHPLTTAPVDDLISKLRRIPAPYGGVNAAEAASNFSAGIRKITQQMREIGTGCAELSRRVRNLQTLLPEPHAFTPDLDLACTHPRCTFTPEQH